jgi:hypothetical protein
MASAFLLGLRGHGVLRIRLAEACSWPYPCCLPRVMVDIICTAEVILASFPSVRQPPLSILESTVGAVRSVLWRCTVRGRHGRRRSRRHGRGRAQAVSRRLRGHGRSLLSREALGMEVLGGLVGRRRAVHRGAAHRRVRGSSGTGTGRRALGDGRGEVSGKVQDQLAVHDHVVVGLFEVACQHLCIVSVYVRVVARHGRTVAARVQVDYRADADVDDAEEALILLLELLLVKDLDREDALLVDLPGRLLAVPAREATVAA